MNAPIDAHSGADGRSIAAMSELSCFENSQSSPAAFLPWIVRRSGPLVILLVAEIVAYWSRFGNAFSAKVHWPSIVAFATYSFSARIAVAVTVAILLFSGHKF